MSVRPIALLAGVLCLALAREAPAQTTVTANTPGGARFGLEAVGGGDPFAAAPLVAAAGTPPTSLITTTIGFSYLRPFWQNQGLELEASAAGSPAVAVISPFGNLANSFGFVPRVDLQYDATSLGFGLGASAQFLSLGGNLERTVAINGGFANLLTTSDLTFLVVNIAEITKTVRAADLLGPVTQDLCMQDDIFGFTVGIRFASVRQSWHAILRGDTSVLASSDASQSFAGLGLTTAFVSDHPCSERWGLYSNLRWSFLVGPNNRNSVVSGVDVLGPFSNSLVENKTTWIPVGEAELGVRYLAPLDPRRTEALGTGPVLSFKLGVVGQYWGGLGFLPAGPHSAAFSDRSLFLVGFTLLAGIEF
jgi:hypothetical protein